jgi:hypothetical protein
LALWVTDLFLTLLFHNQKFVLQVLRRFQAWNVWKSKDKDSRIEDAPQKCLFRARIVRLQLQRLCDSFYSSLVAGHILDAPRGAKIEFSNRFFNDYSIQPRIIIVKTKAEKS